MNPAAGVLLFRRDGGKGIAIVVAFPAVASILVPIIALVFECICVSSWGRSPTGDVPLGRRLLLNTGRLHYGRLLTTTVIRTVLVFLGLLLFIGVGELVVARLPLVATLVLFAFLVAALIGSCMQVPYWVSMSSYR